MNGLDAVFRPRRIAVVGASERIGSIGRLLWENLVDFPGEVLPVTSAPGDVFGRTGYRGLREIPHDVDLALVAVPAPATVEVMRAAADKGVSAAIVLSAGFAESGADGAELQREIRRIARAGGVRLVGPNCFGVQNCRVPLNASIARGLPASGSGRPGISLVTQSGAYGMAVHALGLDDHAAFAKVYSAGNMADITESEVIDYLADDPETAVICVLLESISEPRLFLERAGRASVRKPVLAVVTGRSAAGQRAARSHTASLAADDALRDALLRQAGVIRVRTGLQMLDAARAIVDQPRPAGPRVGIITNSGGVGVELTDLLVDEGLTVPELSPAVRQRCRALLPDFAAVANPVDMTPVWQRFVQYYPALIDLLARSGEVDVVLPVLLQRSATPEVAAAVRDAAAALRRDGVQVPVYVCWVAPRADWAAADLLQTAGVPCLSWPERAAQAVGVSVRAAGSLRPLRAVADARSASMSLSTAPSGSPAALHQRELLERNGIRLASTIRCSTAEQAADAAGALAYPVVLKVDHPLVLHKSDIGGVRTAIHDAEAARRVAGELLALAPGAAVLVQHQHSGLELVVGAVREPTYGPVVMVGVGGVMVEVLADAAFALAPIDAATAEQLWRSLRSAALLDGFRGEPPVDVAALAGLAVTVGDLMLTHPDLVEIDLNPVLAGPTGYLAVDWRVIGHFLPSDVEGAG